jgi:hypothetical protein
MPRKAPAARGHAAVKKHQACDLALVGMVSPGYRENVPVALRGEHRRNGSNPAEGVPDEAAGRGVAPSVASSEGGSRVVGGAVDQ